MKAFCSLSLLNCLWARVSSISVIAVVFLFQIEYGDIRPPSEMALVPSGKLFQSEKSSPQHSPQLLLLAQILERFYPNHYRCSTDDTARYGTSV